MVYHTNSSNDVIKDLHTQIGLLELKCSQQKQKLRKTRKQAKEAERLATLGKLLLAVAHELRNPMGVIRLAVYSLQKKINPKDENIQKHLRNIDKKIIEADKIIRNLLAFSPTSESGFHEFDIHESVEEGLHEVDSYAKKNGVTIEKHFDKRTLPAVAGFTQLTEIFSNVLMNAAQSMEGSKDKKLIVTTKRNHTVAVIRISDTGCGIPEEHFERLEEPFFSTKTEGIGLGLYIVYEMVRRHNGTICIESEVGKGTTFIITLPLQV